MPYNFTADSFHTEKLCSRLSSRKSIFYANRPFLEDLEATYDDHLRLIGKRVVDFLLALIELFSLDVTAEALRAIIGSKSAILIQRRPVDPKFHVEGVAPTNHSSSQKTRLNGLSYDIKIYTDLSTILLQSTRLTDRQTDG